MNRRRVAVRTTAGDGGEVVAAYTDEIGRQRTCAVSLATLLDCTIRA